MFQTGTTIKTKIQVEGQSNTTALPSNISVPTNVFGLVVGFGFSFWFWTGCALFSIIMLQDPNLKGKIKKLYSEISADS